jgi:hypothetical protein
MQLVIVEEAFFLTKELGSPTAWGCQIKLMEPNLLLSCLFLISMPTTINVLFRCSTWSKQFKFFYKLPTIKIRARYRQVGLNLLRNRGLWRQLRASSHLFLNQGLIMKMTIHRHLKSVEVCLWSSPLSSQKIMLNKFRKYAKELIYARPTVVSYMERHRFTLRISYLLNRALIG